MELLAEDDWALVELPTGEMADDEQARSLAAIALVQAGLALVRHSSSRLADGVRLDDSVAVEHLADHRRWSADELDRMGFDQLGLTPEGDALWERFCLEGVGPEWLTRRRLSGG